MFIRGSVYFVSREDMESLEAFFERTGVSYTSRYLTKSENTGDPPGSYGEVSFGADELTRFDVESTGEGEELRGIFAAMDEDDEEWEQEVRMMSFTLGPADEDS